jgi:enoyl-CoA hydratase/carnithine racemase
MDQVVQSWTEGRAGRIRLNRPKALNALDLPMVQLVRAALAACRDDPAVHAVLLDAPERGFCAGGDVRGLRALGQAGDTAAIAAFFAAEYAMNQEIADFPKPFVSLIDGVCMGGGIGISVHGSHRIATERAVFAMPETAIALFPDVGTSYILPRLPGALGMYIGLSGARMAGADAVHAGFATHYVESATLPALAAAIIADGIAVIPAFTTPLPACTFAPHRPLIDDIFSAPSILDIIQRLQASPNPFAHDTLAQLRAHSPSSICWSFELLRRGAKQNLAACLRAEYALVQRVAVHPEFSEGVRAVLVDKDRQPKWRLATIEEVNQGEIKNYFL